MSEAIRGYRLKVYKFYKNRQDDEIFESVEYFNNTPVIYVDPKEVTFIANMHCNLFENAEEILEKGLGLYIGEKTDKYGNIIRIGYEICQIYNKKTLPCVEAEKQN